MRRAASAALAAIAFGACRPYDNAAPLEDQKGLVPAAQFARYGREQAEVMAIGRSLAAWKMTDDEAGLTAQAKNAGCFARRFPDIETVDADPLGHRLTVKFKSGWRTTVLPIPDGIAPESTPGIGPLGESPCKS
jgi:hypothetical protein